MRIAIIGPPSLRRSGCQRTAPKLRARDQVGEGLHGGGRFGAQTATPTRLAARAQNKDPPPPDATNPFTNPLPLRRCPVPPESPAGPVEGAAQRARIR